MALRPSAQTSASTARTPFISQPNASNPSQAPNPNAAMSPELEQTLAMVSSHRSVLGYMLITRGHHPSIIRHSGVVFEGEQGKRYAAVVARIVESVQAGLEEVRVDDGLILISPFTISKDEVKFMRIRTKKHEIMISPDDRYLLAVLHDPTT
ncbi:hypothetical protein CVT25_002856 [Psilocybe cyanescens]|uniref:Roadblock/LAMTOR2 domain-containing protein n=1 Tax=Psilocybe cyanescens TaxID=93625 RepID=A0A409WKV4_PSICY|nr:hypothetical protein CVT25_002856 [Psilocybe cyanescens]